MKKAIFYSQVRENGKIIAKQWTGWTDGIYNYYNNGGWFAIEPLTGFAVTTNHNTRKTCAENAHKLHEKVKLKIENSPEIIARFAALIEEAEKGAAA